MFFRKGAPKIYSKFEGEYPCRSLISIKLQINFIEITLRHECSPVNALHIFRTSFPRNTSGWLLLNQGHIMNTWSLCKWWLCSDITSLRFGIMPNVSKLSNIQWLRPFLQPQKIHECDKSKIFKKYFLRSYSKKKIIFSSILSLNYEQK